MNSGFLEITEGMREEIEYFKKIKGEDKIRFVKSV